MNRFAILLGLLFLAGCSLIPKEKKETAAIRTAQEVTAENAVEIDHVVQGERAAPTPNIDVSGNSNKVDILVNSPRQADGGLAVESQSAPYRATTRVKTGTTQDSSVKSAEKSDSSVTIPAGVKLILYGIGLAVVCTVVFFAVRIARKNSVAAAAAFDATDEGLAAGIRAVRSGFGSAITHVKTLAQTSTDPKEIATLTAIASNLEKAHGDTAANLESERGKIVRLQP